MRKAPESSHDVAVVFRALRAAAAQRATWLHRALLAGECPTSGNSWENQALFDFDSVALPAMDEFRP